MSQDKIAFEKWLYSDDCPINPDGLLTEEIGAMFIAWQAATAEANKRIAELEGRHERDISEYTAMREAYAEVKAHNNDLREALLWVKKGADRETQSVISKALSATPAESLQAFEDEVIEKCAKVCDECGTTEVAARLIRALKGKS